MKYLSLRNIANACDGTYYGDTSRQDCEISGVAIDSRKIEPDFLFVPIKGERVDGHTFIPQVMEQGALCTLSEHELPNAKYPYILVSSTIQALQDIAAYYRRSLDIKVIGITGSVGKTSTKEMVASVLEQKYHVLKTAGNFNNEIGLPLTIFNIREEHEVAILEMGIDGFEQMHCLAKIARPDICIITNIGYCHLEALGDRDGVLKAKTEMFDYMNENPVILLNGDDDKLSTVQEVKGQKPVFFGLSEQNNFYASDVKSLGLKGTACNLHLPNGEILTAEIHIPGNHMVYNALAGAAAGCALGLTKDEIKAGIASLVPVAGRNNLIKTDSLLIIDDCYNANPVSMRASIDVLKNALGRTIAVIGDMKELGENENSLHFETGMYAAEKGVDIICCIGPLAKYMAEGAREGKESQDFNPEQLVLYFETKEHFLEQIDKIVKHGDTVLVKASNSMKFTEIVEKLQELKL